AQAVGIYRPNLANDANLGRIQFSERTGSGAVAGALWRGFKRLAEHSRFEMIEGWQSRLISVLQVPLAWYHAQEIVRVLERAHRSYTLIESRLFRSHELVSFSSERDRQA